MSDAIFTLDAEVRTDLGKGASRRLRHANKVPAILYGEGQEPVSLTLAHNKVFRAQEEEAFYSQVLTLNVDGNLVFSKSEAANIAEVEKLSEHLNIECQGSKKILELGKKLQNFKGIECKYAAKLFEINSLVNQKCKI